MRKQPATVPVVTDNKTTASSMKRAGSPPLAKTLGKRRGYQPDLPSPIPLGQDWVAAADVKPEPLPLQPVQSSYAPQPVEPPVFPAHTTSAATHTPDATGGVVTLLAAPPAQPLTIYGPTVQAACAAVPPPTTGGILMAAVPPPASGGILVAAVPPPAAGGGILVLPTKAPVFLRKQPAYGSTDFWEQITELKALGAAWGPVTTPFADTPTRIRQVSGAGTVE